MYLWIKCKKPTRLQLNGYWPMSQYLQPGVVLCWSWSNTVLARTTKTSGLESSLAMSTHVYPSPGFFNGQSFSSKKTKARYVSNATIAWHGYLNGWRSGTLAATWCARKEWAKKIADFCIDIPSLGGGFKDLLEKNAPYLKTCSNLTIFSWTTIIYKLL